MGLFDKIFGNKSVGDESQKPADFHNTHSEKSGSISSAAPDYGRGVSRPLTTEQREKIDKSTILLRSGQLYMHYWTDELVDADRNDPEWQNKVMFFWKADEPFPRKSLPPVFESFKTKNFLFAGDTSRISVQAGPALPWFDMPGLGEKHVCELNGQQVTIPELNKLGLVEYFELVELSADNLNVLTDRETHFFLIDDQITSFRNGIFYLEGKPVSIDTAYSIGGIRIIKKVGLK